MNDQPKQCSHFMEDFHGNFVARYEGVHVTLFRSGKIGITRGNTTFMGDLCELAEYVFGAEERG